MAVKLKAILRNDLKNSTTKQYRESGNVPGVVYGKGKETKAITVNTIDLVKTVREEGRNAIITLDIENGESADVMLHDYQMDPLKDEVMHVDFYVVDMSEEMDVEVPLRIEGEAIGTKEGGVLQQPLYVLQVRAKPNDIPEEITVDVSELNIGDTIAIADLPSSEKYEFLEEEDTAIVNVLAPDTGSEEDEDADGESAEPELVGAESKEEEQ
ncbi:50S ribosomal protein L25/general stress protein Ctc [Virgibacillus alimentarius]|uniref:Large ribosomal subunit protein bL25 n=1 Tax=Virgibacillus alimentarius TaxID=698769 RepID=A0ABS4S6K4_9BACI|nr:MULTISPECIES: 50S ribosomal protein L25/general stress protein Ctc [Virgibacillus]MBP2257129.1 large subunit ribosomal protein L25 [Virgibacillus alimentarius]HLR66662.1 50S ribosomal protein L25/general stress protein Ctc [Virgibacillus sp.]